MGEKSKKDNKSGSSRKGSDDHHGASDNDSAKKKKEKKSSKDRDRDDTSERSEKKKSKDKIPSSSPSPARGKKSPSKGLLGYPDEVIASPIHRSRDVELGFMGSSGDEEEKELYDGGNSTSPTAHYVSNAPSTKVRPKRVFYSVGGCERCLKYACGEILTDFLVTNRFVLYRLLICVCYFVVGVEVYHMWEGWSRSECFYFITVSTTTVGYGDFFPSDDRSRIFTTFYVIFGILVVLNSANKVIQFFVVQKTQTYVLQFIDLCVRVFYRNCGHKEEHKEKKGATLNTASWFKVMFSMLLLTGMIAGGTIFFMSNEKWTFARSLYWTVCTMLTIGYGDAGDGLQESTRVFLTWFIWVCVIVYIIAITNVTATFDELKAEALRYEILRQHAVDIIDILEDQREQDQSTDAAGLVSYTERLRLADHIENIRETLAMEGALVGGERYSMRVKKGAGHGHSSSSSSGKGGGKKGHGKKGSSSRDGDGEFSYPSRGSTFGQDNPLARSRGNTNGRQKASVSGNNDTTSFMSIKFDELDESVIISDDDVRSIMIEAKKDRFVLDMLMKMGKVDQERDVDVLEEHFAKVENIRSLAARGEADIEQIDIDLAKVGGGGTLLGVANKYLLTNEKAQLKQENRIKGSIVPSSPIRAPAVKGVGEGASGKGASRASKSAGSNGGTQQHSSKGHVVLDHLRRGTYSVLLFFLPLLVVTSLSVSLLCSTARQSVFLHSLTPHGTSLTIISSHQSSINRRNTHITYCYNTGTVFPQQAAVAVKARMHDELRSSIRVQPAKAHNVGRNKQQPLTTIADDEPEEPPSSGSDRDSW
jgi:hypothetical protein